MSTDAALPAELLTSWQQCQTVLKQQPDIKHLLQQSAHLSQQRLLHSPNTVAELMAQTELPVALWRAELIFSFVSWLNWPKPVLQLLLSASYCCGLADNLLNHMNSSGDSSLSRLKAYPALLCARLLQKAQTHPIQQLLAGCYSSERKIPYWQQQPISVLLTLFDKLAPQTADNRFDKQLGQRILHCRCEHEMALLRTMLTWWHQSEATNPVNADSLLTNSDYLQLKNSNNKAVAVTLNTSDALRNPVLQLATELNRQQQSIRSVALAINLIGRGQLDHVLTDALLNQQLSQLHHPQHQALQQLTNAFASSLNLLAPNSTGKAKSRALARCILAPLWFDTHGYRLSMLRRQRENSTALAVFNIYKQPAAAILTGKLLQLYQLSQWHQPLQHVLTEAECPVTNDDSDTRLLLVAWFSCQAIFTAKIPAALQTLLQHYPAHNNAGQWLQHVASDANCQSPLLLTM